MNPLAFQVNAFTTNQNGGNPAGVVLNADDIAPAHRQHIAHVFGFSETAFISKSTQADIDIAFYTPTEPINFCGHATLASFGLLEAQNRFTGDMMSMALVSGQIMAIRKDSSALFMKQTGLVYETVNEALVQEVLHSLQLTKDDLNSEIPTVISSTGNRALMLPLKDEATVAKFTPDFDAITQISNAHNIIGYYPYSLDITTPEIDVAVRSLCPAVGVPEESATGSDAGALSGFLFDQKLVNKEKIIIGQGHIMPVPSPSHLICRAVFENNKLDGIWVGGATQIIQELEIPNAKN